MMNFPQRPALRGFRIAKSPMRTLGEWRSLGNSEPSKRAFFCQILPRSEECSVVGRVRHVSRTDSFGVQFRDRFTAGVVCLRAGTHKRPRSQGRSIHLPVKGSSRLIHRLSCRERIQQSPRIDTSVLPRLPREFENPFLHPCSSIAWIQQHPHRLSGKPLARSRHQGEKVGHLTFEEVVRVPSIDSLETRAFRWLRATRLCRKSTRTARGKYKIHQPMGSQSFPTWRSTPETLRFSVAMRHFDPEIVRTRLFSITLALN